MIPNLNELTDTPIARTNLIKLEEDQLTTIQRLLAPVSNIYTIDFMVQRFTKERKEKSADYYARIHQEVKSCVRQKLGLEAGQEVKYELHCLPNYHHVFFPWRLQLTRTVRFIGRWQNVLKRFVSNSPLKIMTYLA